LKDDEKDPNLQLKEHILINTFWTNNKQNDIHSGNGETDK
jgi:hypothetical protein